MTTFINPTIIVSNAKKRHVGYMVVLDEKEPDKLLIKAKNFKGFGLGNAGSVSRLGDIVIKPKYRAKLFPLIHNSKMLDRINTVLDLVYGRDRLKTCTIHKKGSVNIIKFTK